MIIWLASYPRSGNTLLRMMFKTVFERETLSKYDDQHDIGADSRTAEVVGHRMLGDTWENAHPRLSADTQIHFIKTHDGPEDGGKAIYVAREGRSAAVSYFNYLSRFLTDPPIALADVIAGFVTYGSWSGHLDAWDPSRRPNTLLLTFEQLLGEPEAQIARIAEFCEIEPLRPWRNEFESAQQINPGFFRRGSADKSIAEVQGDDLDLFWMFHRDWMRQLGYGEPGPQRAGSALALRRCVDRHQQRAERQAAELKILREALNARVQDFSAAEEHIRDLQGQSRAFAVQIQENAASAAGLAQSVQALTARIDQWNGLTTSPTTAAVPTLPADPDIQTAQEAHVTQLTRAHQAIAELGARINQLEQFTLRTPEVPLKMLAADMLQRLKPGGRNGASSE